MEPPSRLEKMVGEMMGLRLILTQLLEAEAARSGDPAAYRAKIRDLTLATAETWQIGSDTPEGADRIRRCLRGMLSEFPGPMVVPD